MAIDLQGEADHDWDDSERLLAKTVYKANILDSVANSKVFFRSQQMGEKDLTLEDKRKIANDLLERNLKLFLQRYWKFINVRDIPFFDDVCDDYEVHFYLKEIRRCCTEKARRAQVHNRRYQALKKMVKEGTYFSFEEMRERNPLLFDQLVGRHLPEDRREEMFKRNPCSSFSKFLIETIDRKCVEDLKKQQEEEEACMEEETDESEDEDERIPFQDSDQYVELPEEERQLLVTEFTNMMYESFLSGSDENFDYSSVDDNEEYDSVLERDIDEEEKYFDAD